MKVLQNLKALQHPFSVIFRILTGLRGCALWAVGLLYKGINLYNFCHSLIVRL